MQYDFISDLWTKHICKTIEKDFHTLHMVEIYHLCQTLFGFNWFTLLNVSLKFYMPHNVASNNMKQWNEIDSTSNRAAP